MFSRYLYMVHIPYLTATPTDQTRLQLHAPPIKRPEQQLIFKFANKKSVKQ